MPQSLTVRSLTGAAILEHLDALARLRLRVFREFPYLYDGSEDYERHYLRTYAASTHSLVVLALVGAQVVGAASAVPMVDAEAEFQAPFRRHGVPLERVLYFGESVLMPEWRGRGLGHAFFDHREDHATRLGLPITAFCVVQRGPDHPARSRGYRSLDDFWFRRGYRPNPLLTTDFAWRDLGDQEESSKPMQFWTRGMET